MLGNAQSRRVRSFELVNNNNVDCDTVVVSSIPQTNIITFDNSATSINYESVNRKGVTPLDNW